MKTNPPPPLRLVFWESTAACNLGCVHCRRLEVSHQRSRLDLSTDEASGLIDDLGAHHPGCIFVFSGGEPLMRRDWPELARQAISQGLSAALATNGTLVTPQVARQVAEVGFSRASVSLDGATAATHDAFRRVEGSFDAALRGLRLLRDAGQAVQINMSITRHNAGELEQMFELALAEQVAALHIFIVVPVGCGMEIAAEDRLSPADYERLLTSFYRLSAAADGRISTKATCAPQYVRIAHRLQQELPQIVWAKRLVPPAAAGHGAGCGSGDAAGGAGQGGDINANRGGCLAGSAVCFVSHRGEVFPCGYLPVTCGDVRQQPLSEIWQQSEVFARLRQIDQLQGNCGACDFRAACSGCRARAFAETGDYMAGDPSCSF